jgi:CheY-like chemotaxis protein
LETEDKLAHVFIVDDQPAIRRSFRRILESDDHRISEFEDGRAAFEAAQSDPPDLLVSDIFMPGGDGIELISRLREILPQIPLLAISGGPSGRTRMVLTDASIFGATATDEMPPERS